MRKCWTVSVVALVATAFVVVGSPGALAGPKQVVVGTASEDCKKPDAATVQAGVNLANPGDTVLVCPGTYIEQVTIPADKSGIELRSERKLAAILQAPSTMVVPKAIVRVNGATDVTIRDFVITGPGGSGCDSIRYGVRVDESGSAEINGNHITKIRDAGNSGCQNGVGIQVGRAFEGQIGTAVIRDNVIDEYQKNGITVDNTGSSAEIDHNTITGLGPIGFIAQNGVQISRGATGSVDHNAISDNEYTGNDCSTGVLLFDSGEVEVGHNTVTRNDCSIFLWDTGAAAEVDAEVHHNDVSDSAVDGIDLIGDVSNANVHHNKITQSGSDGIFVDTLSTDNVLAHNKIDFSTSFDADDLSVGTGTGDTANTWEHNQCTTDNHGGALCS